MSCKYVFIAPYNEMADMAREVCRDLGFTDWTIDTGNVEDGLQKAKTYAAQGARIIVSRSITALVISNHLDIPVIDLGASPFDVISGLANARKFGTRIGVVGPPDLVYGCASLGDPMGLEVCEYTVQDSNSILTAIQKAKKDGAEVILGGINETQCAVSCGLNGVLLYTGKNTIAAAMKKAVETLRIRQEEKRRSQQLRTILDHSYEGIIAMDQKGKIVVMNLTARTMLRLGDEAIGRDIKKELPFLEDELFLGDVTDSPCKVYNIHNERIIITSRTVIVDGEPNGVVMTLQHVKDIQTMGDKLNKEVVLKGHVAATQLADVVTENVGMRNIIEQAARYALTDSTILITGETGAGKEMFAQGIHNASKRRNGPFVAINCASIPENLLESELFGYEEGAFTGARRNGRKGYFELANHGTLFLDEIGEIPLKLQANLLRVLQEKQIMRVGGDRVIPVNVRIIAATHRDLLKATREENFRLDLFYRLNVLRLMIPPLRERTEDIPLLTKALVCKKSKELGTAPFELDDGALHCFLHYSWYGNVRELENATERLCIVCGGQVVSEGKLKAVLTDMQLDVREEATAMAEEAAPTLAIGGTERERIEKALQDNRWNRGRASALLGISTTTLWRKMKEYGINDFTSK